MGIYRVKRQRTDDILPGGNVHRGITVPHPDPAHTFRMMRRRTAQTAWMDHQHH